MTTPVFIDTMLRGNNSVRNKVGSYLESTIPTYIDTLRHQNSDLDEYTLPYPQQYLAVDPYNTQLQTYPIVGTYFTGADSFNRVSGMRPTGTLDFNSAYDCTIFCTVTTPYTGQDEANLPTYQQPYRDSTIRLRDDLTAALRTSILASPSFGTAGTPNRLLADLTSIRENYPEPMKMTNNATALWIASGLISITINAIESVAKPIYGNVKNVILGMDMLPFE